MATLAERILAIPDVIFEDRLRELACCQWGSKGAFEWTVEREELDPCIDLLSQEPEEENCQEYDFSSGPLTSPSANPAGLNDATDASLQSGLPNQALREGPCLAELLPGSTRVRPEGLSPVDRSDYILLMSCHSARHSAASDIPMLTQSLSVQPPKPLGGRSEAFCVSCNNLLDASGMCPICESLSSDFYGDTSSPGLAGGPGAWGSSGFMGPSRLLALAARGECRPSRGEIHSLRRRRGNYLI